MFCIVVVDVMFFLLMSCGTSVFIVGCWMV